ncbi:formyltetrahydrofolate deformylase [Streptomyces sp. AD55]|uniref:formyltetrahydrofolate deformylase n=1 Tax=Streptomyces sp. AD55 TaxID=3242895 RepID=UPI003527DFB2
MTAANTPAPAHPAVGAPTDIAARSGDARRRGEGHVLTLDCPESPGIVHAVSRFVVEQGCDILDNQQFGDRRAGHFFMRLHLVPGGSGPAPATDALRRDFTAVAALFGMRWRLEPAGVRRRVLVMASRYGHCLNDLLFRSRSGDLPADVVAVVSNHRDHEALADWYGVPHFHIPVTAATRGSAEEQLLRLVEEFDVDLVVLARYMQILSAELCTRLAGRAINIHHSFLPGFKGAKPYHQAYEYGVKVVGATAHYVTADLDEGPIIAQEVTPVDHTHTPEDLVALGRDTESAALVKAVRRHCEGRVVVHGRRTVVLH